MPPRSRIRTIAAAAAAAAAVGAVGGCGSAGRVAVSAPPGSGASAATDGPVPDATSLVHGARKSYRAATSGHVRAVIDDDGERQVVQIRGATDGSNQEVTVRAPSGTAIVRTVDHQYYIKGNRAFWMSSDPSDPSTATLLADKWVRTPPGQGARFQKLTLRSLLDEMIGEDTIQDSALRTMTTSRSMLDGHPVFVAKSTSKKVSAVTVSADGHNDVVEVAGRSDNGSGGQAHFDGWNSQPRVAVPKGYMSLPRGGPKDDPSI